MSTASITHRPLPMTTAAAAALAVMAFGTVVMTHHHDSEAPPQRQSSNVDHFRKHAGRPWAPPSGGRTMIGTP